MASVQSVLLVGCGKMGGALLQGWVEGGLAPEAVSIVEPYEEALNSLFDEPVRQAMTQVADFSGLPEGLSPDVVVFAVKPQMMAAAVPNYARFVRPGCVFLSIAAGTTIGFFLDNLGQDARVVRAMPNTPAAVGRGMTVLTASPDVDEGQRAICGEFLAAVGEVAWVEDEALLDPVTGVSGSGPAYVFLMIEAMAAAGVEAGLPADLSMQLARATVAGAGELVRQTGEDAAQLRVNVTSPNGTTQEALSVLMAEDGLQPLMTRAILAATRRSRELAG